jgi:hypothetical protein
MRDRDESVRARAVAAIGVLAAMSRPRAVIEPAQRARAVAIGLQDRAPAVRVAAASAATEPELRSLATDRDPDVRSAALRTLADRAPELSLAAATDPAAQVRCAAVAGLVDEAVLEKLASDVDSDVATAALARYAVRLGRPAVTNVLLRRLAVAPPKSLERVRIARAWFLAQ